MRLTVVKSLNNIFIYLMRYNISTTTICRCIKKQSERHIQFSLYKCLVQSFMPVNRTTKLLFSFFSLLGLQSEKEDTPEEKLKTTIKRSILCIQREQYDKAEQMLHLALKMAQDIQNKDGITYIYDVMANLAMEREDFKKAENLFVEVMKRLFQDGYTEDHIKVLSISSKLAHIAEMRGDFAKASLGFDWSLRKLKEHLQNFPNDKDAQELWSLTRNWFGQLLMKQKRYEQAVQCFKDALAYVKESPNIAKEDIATILNNLSVAYLNLENYNEAKHCLCWALELLQNVKNSDQEALLQANLGLIYLQEGLLEKAKSYCFQAWKRAKETKSDTGREQAEYCIDKIKNLNKGIK